MRNKMSNREIPYIRNNILHRPDGAVILRLPLRQGERTGWRDWLQDSRHTSFRFESVSGLHLIANKERRVGATGNEHYYWIAYRSIGGKKRRVSLGKSAQVTLRRLEWAAHKLAKLALPNLEH